MKTKILSLLLVLVLVIGIAALNVMAEETTEPAVHKHCVCGDWCDGRGDHDCDSLEEITWTPFSLDLCETMSDGRLIIPAGNYYLAEDLKTDKAFVIAPDTEVSICLNGKTLESSSRVFRVHGTLNIAECTNGTGKVIGTNGGSAPVFYVAGKGHINHYRGILRASQDSKNFGGVGAVANDALVVGDITYVAEAAPGSYTMYGGTLDASKVTLVKNSSNKQGYGGAVVIFGTAAAPCSFTQYGGTIKGAKSVENLGAAIYAPTSATVKLMGGNIENGVSKNLGDGVYAEKGCDFTIGGTAKIDDVYIPGDGIINVENLTGSVGITRAYNTYSVFANCDTADSAAHLTSNVDGRSLVVTEAEGKFQVALSNVHADHCVCGGNLTGAAAENHVCAETAPTWTALTSENIARDAGITVASDRETDSAYNMFAQSGHYYLTENIKLAKNFEIRPGQNITICLNGYTLSTGHSQSIFRITGGTLSICDCTGKGTVKSTWTGTAPIAYLLNGYADATEGVTFNLYGGNLTSTGTSTTNSAGVAQISNNNVKTPAIMNIYGGTITGTSRKTAGCINMVNSVAAQLNIYGGTIKGGSAVTVTDAEGKVTGGTGGNIHCSSGSLNIYGGTITGGTAGTYGGNIYINNVNTDAGRVAPVTMTGGSITNGTAKTRGGNVYLEKGTFTMTAGTITGGTLTEAQYGADLASGGNKPMAVVLNGKVTIGEMGAFGSTADDYAIELGDNFSATKTIKLSASKPEKIIKSATYADLAYFVSGNDAYQLTCENYRICLRDAALDYHCRCGGNMTEAAKTYMEHTNCSDILWTDLTQATIDALDVQTGDALGDTISILPAGNYKLVEDITCANSLTVAKDTTVNLDLNGHTLTGTETAKRAVLAKGKLNISDSAYNPADENAVWGKIVGSNTKNAGHALYVGGDSESRLYGGEITSAFTEASVGGPVGIGGKFHMAGGKITGLTKSASNGGAMVMNDSAAVTLWGGIVQGGEASRGGAIYVSKEGQSLSIRGDAQIIGGSAKQGGNIYALGDVSVDEEAVISGGIAFSGTIKVDGKNTSVGGGGNIYSEASVYVKGGQIIGGQATRAEGSSLPAYGGNIYLNKSDAAEIVKITGGVVADGVAPTGGNIFCRSSFEMTGGTVSGGEATSAMAGNIRLEGSSKNPVFTITGGEIKDGVSYQQGANLVIRNSSEAVVIKNASFIGGECTSHHGGNVYITGQLNSVEMENVTISGGKAFNRAGNLYIMGSADLEVAPVVTLTNCVITDGVSGSRGGNIYMGDVNATLNNCTVTGGSIVEGTETDPFNMYGYNLATNYGNYETYITINGGTYTGAGENNLSSSGVHVLSGEKECTLTVSGLLEIDALRLGTARMLTIGEAGLEEGSSIGISRFEVTGLIAPGAAQYQDCFHTDYANSLFTDVVGEDLYIVSDYPYWAFTATNKGLGSASSIAEAYEKYGDSIGFVRVVQPDAYVGGELMQLDKPVYLDINGSQFAGLIVGSPIYVIDSKTNKYEEGAAGIFAYDLIEGGSVNDGKNVINSGDCGVFNSNVNYVMVDEGGLDLGETGKFDTAMSFHAIKAQLTYVTLDPANDALGYKAEILGDSKAKAAVDQFGLALNVEGANPVNYLKPAKEDGTYSLRLKNIMKYNGGEMTIYGAPVLVIGDTTITFASSNTTMKKTIQAVNDMETLSDAQKSAVYELYAQYESVMSAWLTTNNIATWAPVSEEIPAA